MPPACGSSTSATSAGNLIAGLAAELADRFELKAETVHVALRQIAPAGVERQAPIRRNQVLEGDDLRGGLVAAEALPDERKVRRIPETNVDSLSCRTEALGLVFVFNRIDGWARNWRETREAIKEVAHQCAGCGFWGFRFWSR